MNVAVVGASDNPERTSHQAVARLRAEGHRVFPVHPKLKTVLGLDVYPSLDRIPEPVHTVSLYVSAAISDGLRDALTALKPKRVLFNPGAENPALREALEAAGIQTLEACTLVLLSTKRF